MAFSDAHMAKLEGVDPRLIEMMTYLRGQGHNFGISEGLRDAQRQQELYNQGKSKTLNSKHLTGNAVDIHMLDDEGRAIWDAEQYKPIGEAAKAWAKEQGHDFTWGGDWGWDSVHFQMNGPAYAAAKDAGLSDEEATAVARNATGPGLSEDQSMIARSFGPDRFNSKLGQALGLDDLDTDVPFEEQSLLARSFGPDRFESKLGHMLGLNEGGLRDRITGAAPAKPKQKAGLGVDEIKKMAPIQNPSKTFGQGIGQALSGIFGRA